MGENEMECGLHWPDVVVIVSVVIMIGAVTVALIWKGL